MDINDKAGRTSKQKHSKVSHHINEYSVCINKLQNEILRSSLCKEIVLKNKRNVTTRIYKKKKTESNEIISMSLRKNLAQNTNVCMNDIDITNQS